MSLPKLGFLGLGWIGRNRLEALMKSGAAQVAAVCEPDAAALQAARELAPGAAVVSSLSQLLELPLDGVVIATPSALHAEQTLAALSRGLPVFCQKPLGRNADEVARIVAAAKQRDVSLGVDLSYRRARAVEELADVVRSGALGKIFAVNLVFHNAYGPDKAWFYDPAHAGGGALMDLGIHLVDLLLWTLGFPEVTDVSSRVFSQAAPLTDPRKQVEDYVAAQLTLGDTTVVQLACSWRLHAGCDCAIAAEFFGSEGGVSFRNLNGSFYDFSTHAFTSTRTRQLAAPPDAWGGRMLVDWAQGLARGARFDPQSEHAIDVARLIDRIYASARRGGA
jgi:predicted dehydrogenase